MRRLTTPTRLQRVSLEISVNPSTTVNHFLDVLARGCPEGSHLVLAKKVPSALKLKDGTFKPMFPAVAWSGQPLPTLPWYVCNGAAAPTVNGKTGKPKLSREVENITSLRFLVCDDVGEKYPESNIKVPPTWVLQSSAGSKQYGFLLEWTDDFNTYNALNKTLVKHDMQDPGAVGINRLSRIPGSINDKPKRGNFVSVLLEWHPDRVYTLDALVAAFNLPLEEVLPHGETHQSTGSLGCHDIIFDWLRDNDMLLGRKNDLWWYVRCPFEHEHSNVDLGTTYKPLGADDRGHRGVKCFHSHGDGENEARYSSRFFDALENLGAPRNLPYVPEIDARMKAALSTLGTPAAAAAAVPKEEPPEAAAASPESAPEPGDLYTFGTLRQALGALVREELPFTDVTKSGFSKLQPVTYENVENALQQLGVLPRLNLMTAATSYILPEKIDMARFGTKTDAEIASMVDAAVADICARAGMRAKRDVRDCIARIANSHYWHPMRDWIRSKPWDGKDRLELLYGSVSTPTPDVFRTLFRRWLLQTIEATCGWTVRRHSQKALVLVLVGEQGIGKTRWLTALAPGFSAEGKQLKLDGQGARDSKHEALQAAVVELGELDVTFRKSDMSALKGFLTSTVDEYRLPYAQDWLTRPRCTSFCGSVNDGEFLNDPTGTRRFLPVAVTKCFDEHGVDMQQLWAQVHALWLAGEQWWLTDPETQTRVSHSVTFEQTDGVAEHIEDESRRRSSPEHAAEYSIECGLGTGAIMRLLGLPHTHPVYQSRASSAMQKLHGPARDMRHRNGGKRAWVWRVSSDELRQFNLMTLRPMVTK